MKFIYLLINLSLSLPGKLRANLITSPKLVSDPFMGFRKPGKFCSWNQKSLALESGIQLKESGIPLTIGIRNPSSTDKTGVQYLKSGLIHGVESRI